MDSLFGFFCRCNRYGDDSGQAGRGVRHRRLPCGSEWVAPEWPSPQTLTPPIGIQRDSP